MRPESLITDDRPAKAGSGSPRPYGRRRGDSPRWSDGKRDPVARIAAQVIGLTPISAEHLMRSINHRVAAIVHAFKQLGDEDRLAKFLEPIDRAREGREPPPDVEATWTAAQQADAMEDVAELRYLCDKSPKNLFALIRSTREEIRYQTAKLDMLLDVQREQEHA